MTPELKAKWLEDLKVKPKTIGHLKDDKGYCCLGVLIETMGYRFNTTAYGTDGTSRWYEPVEDLNAGNELSMRGMELAGLSRDAHDELTRLNDDNDTFEPVIEYIEENL